MLVRLVYLSVTGVFGLLRLLPASDRDKDVEILVLRHQIAVVQRQLGATTPRFSPADRAFLAALLHRLPRDLLGGIGLLVRFSERSMRWFDTSPRRGDAEGPQILHLPRSTASNKISYLTTSLSALVAHWGARSAPVASGLQFG